MRLLILQTLLITVCLSAQTHDSVIFQHNEQHLWTPFIQAQLQAKDLSSQYYLCGYSFLKRKWTVNLWNCNCGRRWYQGRKRYRCNWCPNYFQSMASGFKGIFCKYTNWDDQIQKQFVTGDPLTTLWRPVVMCPKNRFVNGVAARMDGVQHSTALKLNGLFVKCSTNTLSQYNSVQDQYRYPLTPLHTPKLGTFVSGFTLKYIDKNILTGIKINYEYMPVISKIILRYSPIIDPDVKPYSIQSQTLSNNGTVTAQQTLTLTKTYSTTNTWKTENSVMTGFAVSTSVSVGFPKITGGSSVAITHYRQQTQSFSFGKQIKRTYSSGTGILVFVPACKRVTVSSVIQQKTMDVPFQADLTFSDRISGSFIKNETVKGIWSGVLTSNVNVNIEQQLIDSCQKTQTGNLRN